MAIYYGEIVASSPKKRQIIEAEILEAAKF